MQWNWEYNCVVHRYYLDMYKNPFVIFEYHKIENDHVIEIRPLLLRLNLLLLMELNFQVIVVHFQTDENL